MLHGKALREGLELYALSSNDLLDVVASLQQDEVAEMRLLTHLAASAGSRNAVDSTRVFIAKIHTEEELKSAQSANSPVAAAAARAAESMMGGPA